MRLVGLGQYLGVLTLALEDKLAAHRVQQRAALTLHYLEDSPYEEVAQVMGVPLNTVKSHISRGKEHMAHLLGGVLGIGDG